MPTSAQMFIKGAVVGGVSRSVLRNTAGDLENMGMLLTHKSADVGINQLNDYQAGEVEANGGVKFEAQMYHIDDTEVLTSGTVSTPVTFVVTYQTN